MIRRLLFIPGSTWKHHNTSQMPALVSRKPAAIPATKFRASNIARILSSLVSPTKMANQFETTKLLYLQDTYQFECMATVTQVFEEDDPASPDQKRISVVLDQTVMHPQGGGQPSDAGCLIMLDSPTHQYTVVGLKKGEKGQVIHQIKAETENHLQVNDRVKVVVDESTRRLHARLHSAGHLLDASMQEIRSGKYKATKGSHSSTMAFVEFLGVLDSQERDNLVVELNTALQAKLESQDQQQVLVRMDRTANTRYITLGGLECACGGTHVKRIQEIGTIKVTKVKKSTKETFKVSYEVA